MTTFRTRSDRAIARSRGHVKKAEEAFFHESPVAMSFSMGKANHALAVGRLHEQSRLAAAAEIATIIDFLNVDPEGELAEIVAPEEAEQLQVRVRNWLLEQIETTGELGDGDD